MALVKGTVKHSTTYRLCCPPPQPPRSFACRLSVDNFSQRVSLIRELRNAETKENSQRKPNTNNVVIKHRQGDLVPSQGL